MALQPCPLSENASRFPNRTALITDARLWSYRELDQLVSSLCQQLKERGICAGQRISFIAINTLSTLLLFPALFRLQAIACPLSTRIPPEQRDTHCHRLKAAHHIDPATLQLIPIPSLSPALISPSSLATFLFTSGSSGTPKIACHTLANHIYNALGALEALQIDATTHYLLSLPLFHVGGIAILFRCWLSGSTLILSTLYTHPLTHLSLVPTQLYRLLQHNPTPPPSLRCLLLGGAPASPQLLQRAQHHRWPVYTTYGLTEASSMVTLQTLLPFREIKLVDTEIHIRGKTLFQGYWNTEQETIECPLQDGWFATKDLGRLHADGTLDILGRKDRQFISGGENIQPEEIERALCSLPGILAAHVTSTEDEEFGKRPIAFIEDATHTYTLETIRTALKPSLPSFKHPIRLFPLSIPKGSLLTSESVRKGCDV